QSLAVDFKRFTARPKTERPVTAVIEDPRLRLGGALPRAPRVLRVQGRPSLLCARSRWRFRRVAQRQVQDREHEPLYRRVITVHGSTEVGELRWRQNIRSEERIESVLH